ncbi:MAG TPA: aldo/keto reductase, partial [Chitinophagaceae bacterium]|nr:aldo/keto reductase [Chitinophagaceae bacterium]
ARFRGWSPPIATQVHYNLIERTAEAELVPMGLEHGVAVQPWSPLAGGVLTGKYKPEDAKTATSPDSRKAYLQDFGLLSQKSLSIVDEVKKIAKEIGKTPSQVALNWIVQKPGVYSPIIGARKIEQLKDNLGALDFCLSDEQMKTLNNPDFGGL